MSAPADYRGLLALSPDGVIVVRADGSILEVNDKLVALFGYSAADLSGVPVTFLLPLVGEPMQLALTEKSGPHATRNTSASAIEYWVQNADGRTLAVDVNLAAIAAQGAADALVCISVRDVTQRKKLEQAMDEAKLRSDRFKNDLLDLSNTLPLAIFQGESDEAGISKYTFISARVQELLGIPASTILAEPQAFLDCFVAEDVRHLIDLIAHARERVRLGSRESSLSLAMRAVVDGEQRWLRISTVYGGCREDGRSIWNGYLEDITRRKKIEEDKELATFQFKTLWEKSPDTYLFRGPKGILSSNEPALELFGLDSPDELLGHCTGDPIFSPELQPNGRPSGALFEEVLAYASALVRGDDPAPVPPEGLELRIVRGSVKFEWLLLRRHGTPFYADMVVTPMQFETHDGHLLICQDISLQKQAQLDLLRAKQAAEDTARTKADFLANMSHEIRTPMNAIVGLSHLMLRTPLDRTQQNYVGKIQDSGKHLLGIINDILDSSKMDAGKLSIEQRDFALSKVLENLTNLIGDKAQSKNLELVFEVAPEVPEWLNGDALRLGQILVNYANNAVKFTPAGEICIAIFPIFDDGQQVTLRFEVRDTGIGLSPEQMAGLFQSFAQADNSITRKYGGTGLGLAISKSLAELMHGEVGVVSKLGQGSTFWFTARLQRGKPAAHSVLLAHTLAQAGNALEQQLASIAGARILLVEDNELNQLVASELLSGIGLVVDIAENGQVAVERILQTPAHWDLVLMDMQMPVLDGVSATRLVRQHLGSDLPVIVAMTANAMPQHTQACTEAGMQGFVAKPIDPDQLWAALLRWIAPREAPTGTALARKSEALLANASIPRGIDGLEVQQGLRRVLGNERSYLKMLRKFISGQRDAVRQVEQALALDDWHSAERLAHTLKGVAGNIGATRVQGHAALLEQALCNKAQRDAVDQLARQTQRSLQDLTDLLEQRLPPDVASTAAVEVDSQRLQALVQQLKGLMQDDDASALDLFADNTALLQSAFPGNFKELQSALEKYEFGTALEYLSAKPA